ncbi:S8 family serine peptidase [Microbacterium suwonense]|uniref:Type VII secretion-associated serine protease n=1 Tax=Microbacterium suwonense TaxID=683047 RepID=A0ABN6X4U3_9MICO|nr:S8 family serine peptidase [Microbacterium suwonense]BDZ39597.1 type VII secretion-associated serine protease [Microbacterium suwonense]
MRWRGVAAALGIVAMLGLGAPGAAGATTADPVRIGTASSPVVDAATQCTPGQRILTPGASYLVRRLGLQEAWLLSRGRGVTVAVVDSGVEAGNVHLTDALVPGHTTFGDGSARPDDDLFGHGTAIAGLIAARQVEGSGVVGIAPEARIMPVRAFESAPEDGQSSRDLEGPSATSVAAGIRWAAEHGAQIINVSLSDSQSVDQYRSAVAYARAQGSLVVASAGNRKTADANLPDPAHFYPGELDGALAVAGVLRDGAWDPDSSFSGAHVDIAAPGQSMPSAYISGGDCVFNGDSASSSYATAVVSGAAALVAARFPDETPDEWAFRLTQSAMRVSPAHRSDTVGWGEVRPLEALALIDDGTLPGPASPAHPAPAPAPPENRTIDVRPAADPLDPARAIVGWTLGAGATASVIMLLLARGRARRRLG